MKPETQSLLLTDLYQLTMLEGYFRQEMFAEAVFDFFVRRLPPGWNFLLAAGLEQVLDFLERARFEPEEIEWLRGTGRFSGEFLDWLAGFRFTGSVDAMPEGTLCFPDEPLLRVTAPLPQAQLVETRLINLLQYQTLIASKAARCRLAAPEKLLVDFGLRRAHGAEAGMLAARASYLAGFAGSSNVLAGMRYGLPIFGTMAHAFVQAHDDETEAFEHFARAQPGNVVLLIDTYDTEAAASRLGALARRLEADGIRIKAVRIDSGDLADHAHKVREILDAQGLQRVGIFASGDLDEFRLQQLAQSRAPIDGYGIGTRLVTAADHPYLNCAYKLQEYAGRPRRKRSEGKATWPGRKQVWRRFNDAGEPLGDLIGLVDEVPEGRPLLEPVMREGRRLHPPVSLERIRERVVATVATLPGPLTSLSDATPPYPVIISDGLQQLARCLDRGS